jgi:type IV secretion system T-DNA border endonuclease VirD2
MADALALYRLVMGEEWEDDLRGAAMAREAAAARQRRSLRTLRTGQGRRLRLGRPLARSVSARAAGSRAAVFKRIRSAGCHTGAALWRQLSYVNDKADLCFSSARSLGDDARMTWEEKTALVESWQATWRGSTKLGFTSHMLLSFPEGTDPVAVRGIAVEWCEHFFDSALYGDRWEYVLAIHTDRAHPHAHVLLNNRGVEHGTWFSCWEGGVMSPQLMREKQAEIAGHYGVALEATTRLAGRGSQRTRRSTWPRC